MKDGTLSCRKMHVKAFSKTIATQLQTKANNVMLYNGNKQFNQSRRSFSQNIKKLSTTTISGGGVSLQNKKDRKFNGEIENVRITFSAVLFTASVETSAFQKSFV